MPTQSTSALQFQLGAECEGQSKTYMTSGTDSNSARVSSTTLWYSGGDKIIEHPTRLFAEEEKLSNIKNFTT